MSQHKIRSQTRIACYLGRWDKKGSKQIRLADANGTNAGKLLLQVKHWNGWTEQLGKVMEQNEPVAQHVGRYTLHRHRLSFYTLSTEMDNFLFHV